MYFILQFIGFLSIF